MARFGMETRKSRQLPEGEVVDLHAWRDPHCSVPADVDFA